MRKRQKDILVGKRNKLALKRERFEINNYLYKDIAISRRTPFLIHAHPASAASSNLGASYAYQKNTEDRIQQKRSFFCSFKSDKNLN